jgi:hypothetical protein
MNILRRLRDWCMLLILLIWAALDGIDESDKEDSLETQNRERP